VKLTVNGHSYKQPITVKQDPRVTTAPAVMQQVYALTEAIYFGAVDARAAAASLSGIRDQVAKLKPQAQAAAAQALTDFDNKVAALQGGAADGGNAGRGAGGRGGPSPGGAAAPESLNSAAAGLVALMNSLQAADVAPTEIQLAAIAAARQAAARVTARWTAMKTVDLTALNAVLKTGSLAKVRLQ
jgi:hypothetical protein